MKRNTQEKMKRMLANILSKKKKRLFLCIIGLSLIQIQVLVTVCFINFSPDYQTLLKRNKFFYLNQQSSSALDESNNVYQYFVQLKSKCECRQHLAVNLLKYNKSENIYFVNVKDENSGQIVKSYTLTQDEFLHSMITCDLYSVLRRGKASKVLGNVIFYLTLSYKNDLKNHVRFEYIFIILTNYIH